jgi:hypothetical protein
MADPTLRTAPPAAHASALAAPSAHKNKTLAALLAFLLGTLGSHRLYLRGSRDKWAWAHLSSIPASALLIAALPQADAYFKLLPLIVSALAGCLEALVLGLMADEAWDARFNAGSGRFSASSWPLALILVLTLMVGAGALIATIARLFDLLYTGGAYG